jgi:formate-dependent nitrite reductase membrane component NrfD
MINLNNVVIMYCADIINIIILVVKLTRPIDSLVVMVGIKFNINPRIMKHNKSY